MRLSEDPAIQFRDGGRVLVVSCRGDHDGKGPCGGWIRIPFAPGLDGGPGGTPGSSGAVWERKTGSALDDLTLEPSINAHECGHFYVRDGAFV